MHRQLTVLGLAAVLASTLLAMPASGTEDTDECAPFVQGSAPTLHPEGIAYDPLGDRFLVGSVTHGTVGAVNPDGTVLNLVSDPALITTMGVAVDAERGRILVANGDIGVGDRTDPSTVDKTAGLGIYDLTDGSRIDYLDLGALNPERGHFGNDIAIAPDGTAYVTDSLSGAIYQVSLYGPPSVLVRDDRLAPTGSGNGANGIVLDPNGFLLVAQSSAKMLYRVPLDDPANLQPVTVDQPIGAPDGLLADGPDGLLAIDNTAANRVERLVSADGWRTATLERSQSWPDPAPTTMARGECGVYVLTGRLDQLLGGTPIDEFRLRRLG